MKQREMTVLIHIWERKANVLEQRKSSNLYQTGQKDIWRSRKVQKQCVISEIKSAIKQELVALEGRTTHFSDLKTALFSKDINISPYWSSKHKKTHQNVCNSVRNRCVPPNITAQQHPESRETQDGSHPPLKPCCFFKLPQKLQLRLWTDCSGGIGKVLQVFLPLTVFPVVPWGGCSVSMGLGDNSVRIQWESGSQCWQ